MSSSKSTSQPHLIFKLPPLNPSLSQKRQSVDDSGDSVASPPVSHPPVIDKSQDLDRMELEYPAPSLPGCSPTLVFQCMPKFVGVESDPCTFHNLAGIRVWSFTEIVDATSGAVDLSHRKADYKQEVLMETDLWHIVDNLVAQVFVTVEEQLCQSPN
ncbi:hypothetical protein GYMLUDRAFT_247563 [Collybiopsis luxurians FD-317 M1]|uniref:Uncharacterized protein n=1 Tax=Collybiopsis luxurians FD-317 M1 TaxID=944289 RepID=A0A0D0CND3_9AGAR|nr:hypothetical protein GYMLUDRAFT_247563 [Collybiopsis luxurians FD-317 M1]